MEGARTPGAFGNYEDDIRNRILGMSHFEKDKLRVPIWEESVSLTRSQFENQPPLLILLINANHFSQKRARERGKTTQTPSPPRGSRGSSKQS